MAITTYNQVIQGVRPPRISTSVSTTSGCPPNTLKSDALYNFNSVATIAGGYQITNQTTTPFASLRPYDPPTEGASAYISGVSAIGDRDISAGNFFLLLSDALWVTFANSSGVQLSPDSSLQTINSIAFPPRDNNNTSNGEGVYIGLGIRSNFGVGNAVGTISYTNSAGISGRTGTIEAIGGLVGTANFFSLQAGDLGVRSIETFQWELDRVSGTFYLYAARPIAAVQAWGTAPSKYDAVSLCLPRLPAEHVLIWSLGMPSFGYAARFSIQISHG